MNIKSRIPNALSVGRILLTSGIVLLLLVPSIPVALVIILILLVFASDILDGIIARQFNTSSKAGATLDIIADSYYVLATSAALVFRDIMPVAILICIVVEFAVFIATSPRLASRHQSMDYSPFYIEKFGRNLTIYLYFTAPMIFLIGHRIGFNAVITPALVTVCVVLTALAIVYRLYLWFAS